MTDKTAILVDGGYFKACFKNRFRTYPSADNVLNHCEAIQKHELLKKKDLLRIFYYDCLPYDGKLKNPFTGKMEHYSETHQYKDNSDYLNELKVKPNIAMRTGVLQLNGWKINDLGLENIIKRNRKIKPVDIKEDFKQKRIDMKIGLDIAWLSGRQIVDTIVLVTGDTDFIPAMKFARKEGINVIVNILTTDCSPDLKEHSDLILQLKPLIKKT